MPRLSYRLLSMMLYVVLLACCANSSSLRATEPTTVELWPAGAPGETGEANKEHEQEPRPGDNTIRLTDITRPTISVYRPATAKNTRTAVVVCPGGGYRILAWNKEGTEVAEWLNSIGVTGIVLKYRVPAHQGRDRHAAPLQDTQRALSLVREHAKEWDIDPARVGILGFSAGGHLSATASTNFSKRAYPAGDAADQLSCRPDFALLIYPAYLAVAAEGNKLPPEINVTSDTPPTFLAQTEDDGVRVESSVFYYIALKNAKVKAEMHLYPVGGHGYGLRPSEYTVSTWPKRAEEWMRSSGWLDR